MQFRRCGVAARWTVLILVGALLIVEGPNRVDSARVKQSPGSRVLLSGRAKRPSSPSPPLIPLSSNLTSPTSPQEYCQHHFFFSLNRPVPGFSIGAVSLVKSFLDSKVFIYNLTVNPGEIDSSAFGPSEATISAAYNYSSYADFGGTIVYKGNCSFWVSWYPWLTNSSEYRTAMLLLNASNIQYANVDGGKLSPIPPPYYRQLWLWKLKQPAQAARNIQDFELMIELYNSQVPSEAQIIFHDCGVDQTMTYYRSYLPCCWYDVGCLFDFRGPPAWAYFKQWQATSPEYQQFYEDFIDGIESQSDAVFWRFI